MAVKVTFKPKLCIYVGAEITHSYLACEQENHLHDNQHSDFRLNIYHPPINLTSLDTPQEVSLSFLE